MKGGNFGNPKLRTYWIWTEIKPGKQTSPRILVVRILNEHGAHEASD